jgi:hypothetical protein
MMMMMMMKKKKKKKKMMMMMMMQDTCNFNCERKLCKLTAFYIYKLKILKIKRLYTFNSCKNELKSKLLQNAFHTLEEYLQVAL